MKKVLAVLIAIMMMVMMMPVAALADEVNETPDRKRIGRAHV